MDLFDFFMPEQAQATHLRNISRSLSHNRTISRSSSVSARQTADKVSDLRDDVNFLTLVLASILRRLAETKTMSLADVSDLLGEIDGLDGFGDGGLDPGVLRGLLGVIKQDLSEEESEEEQINIVTTPRYRRR